MSHSTTEASNSVNKSIPKYNRPHLIVPSDDMEWVLDQKQAIQTLWKEAWKCDPYGSRFVQFSTSLSKSAFAAARKVLKEARLFEFKAAINKTDNRKTDGWLVKNLHGARQVDFWANQPEKIETSQKDLKSTTEDLEYSQKDLESFYKDCNSTQILTEQASCNLSGSIQDLSNKLNQEKEINNTNTLYENKYIKPDLDPARVREGENKKPLRFEEATLNATPHIDTQKELPKHLSVVPDYIPTSELSAIAKSKYGDKLPEIKPGLSRKSIRINEAGLTKLYILHLFDAESKAVQSILDRNDGTYGEVKSFLAECSDLVVAVFTFVGKDLAQFSLCG